MFDPFIVEEARYKHEQLLAEAARERLSAQARLARARQPQSAHRRPLRTSLLLSALATLLAVSLAGSVIAATVGRDRPAHAAVELVYAD
jgi:Flp pilus assembly protein TadB